ncbi:hypothetical protein H4Q26_015489 [Puccinia striiformis f. sp. tritici PST-130]|nr:hypothetical protein H4Q26_015489 [Puccinia striiformis f. sp. tritici PST-130]
MSSLSTINHNITTLESNLDVNTTKILRTVKKCYIKSAKTSSEISDQLSDPLPVQMGPLEKSLVSHLKKEIDKVSNLVKNINGTSNPESIESLTTQIKYLRDTVYNLQNKQKELISSLPKQNNKPISDIFASLRIEIKSLTDIASVLSQKPTPDNSADIIEKLEQSEASILSNIKQDLITEVRLYVQKEVETLTTTVTTSFEGIMSQLRNMEQNSNDKFNDLQRDIVEIKKEIISVDNRVAKAETNRLTSPLTHSSPTPFKTVVETENKNSPSRDLPPHQTQNVKEDDDRGPRLTEKEVGKLLPPLSEWVTFSGEGEYDYIEFIQYCDLILETYWAKEDIVVVRLPRLFRGVAKVWWKTKSAAMGKASWQTWKDLMKAQFNTSTWRSKMKEAFRKEKLDPSVHVISTWCVAQHRRLECISPGLSLKEINEEILERCPGTLANSVNCRLPDLNVDLTVLMNTMEDIVTKHFQFKASARAPPAPVVHPNTRSTAHSAPDSLLARVRFRPGPSPRPTSTPIDYSPELGYSIPPCKSPPTRALTNDLDTNVPNLDLSFRLSRLPIKRLINQDDHPSPSLPDLDFPFHSSTIDRQDNYSFPMTPEENQNLINHYLTVVKQQRADNPPPPPFVDPLTPDERLDGIIKTVLADQESRLDQQIDFNRSLREYRAVKKNSIYEFMIYLTSELLKDPRPTLHSRDFDATLFKKKFEKLEKILSNDKHNPLYTQNLATFNIRFERYQEALVQAQEIEVQATQTKDKTVIPTTKNLKIESRTAQTEHIALPAPEVTGNIHLNNYLAKKSITEKPIDKKEKSTRKKLLPLDFSIGDLSISSFTTEPYFEDLEPTTKSPSPALKKITRKPALPILLDSEDELDEDLAAPILNPSTLIPKDEQNNLENPIKVLQTPKEPSKHPESLGIIREPLSSDESRASSEMDSESESEDEIPEAEIIRILIKKQVKIHAKYLKATSNKEKKVILDQAQQNQLRKQPPRPNPLELQPRPNSLDQQSQPNPFKHEQRPRSVEQQLKTDSLEPKQQTLPRGERRSRRPSEVEGSTSSYCNNSADIIEKLEQSEASILSNIKQDLITEVRLYVQKEVETLTTTVTTSFEGIMSQLRNMEQNSNDKFNDLQRDILLKLKTKTPPPEIYPHIRLKMLKKMMIEDPD